MTDQLEQRMTQVFDYKVQRNKPGHTSTHDTVDTRIRNAVHNIRECSNVAIRNHWNGQSLPSSRLSKRNTAGTQYNALNRFDLVPVSQPR